MKVSTRSFFLLLLCMVVAAPAQSKGHRTHYREHGERIDVYSYAKFGRLHVVLKNYNRKYTINYTLSGAGSVRLNDDAQGPGFVTYEGITDTSGGYYRSARPVRYAADALIGAERIYVSKVENDLLTDAIKQEISEGRCGNCKDLMDVHSVLFFIKIPEAVSGQ